MLKNRKSFAFILSFFLHALAAYFLFISENFNFFSPAVIPSVEVFVQEKAPEFEKKVQASGGKGKSVKLSQLAPSFNKEFSYYKSGTSILNEQDDFWGPSTAAIVHDTQFSLYEFIYKKVDFSLTYHMHLSEKGITGIVNGKLYFSKDGRYIREKSAFT